MSDSKYDAHWNLAKLIISLDTARAVYSSRADH